MHSNKHNNDNLSSQSDPDIKLGKDVKNEGFVTDNYNNIFYAPTSPSGYNLYGGMPGNMSMPSPSMTVNYSMNVAMSHIPSPSPGNELFGNNPTLQQRPDINYQLSGQPNSMHPYQMYQPQVNPQNIYQNQIPPQQYAQPKVPSVPFQPVSQPTQVPVNQMPIQQQTTTRNSMMQPNSMPPEVVLTDIGTRLKLSGNLEEAMQRYNEATKANDSYAPAYYNIGVIFSELGKYDEALEGYQQAIIRNPYYVEAYCNIGVIYKNLGDLDKAVDYYDKALTVNPNFRIARNNMAIALTDLGTKVKNEGEIKKSIDKYKRALVFNALYPDAYYNLGVAYGERGLLDKAIVSYELGIHFNPLCCEAYNNLGVIFKDRDNLERAIECYKSALEINPKFAQTLNNLGVVYTMQGKLDEAYKYVKGALEANPNYAEAYNNLGVLYRDEGKMAEAIFCYDRCLKFNPMSRNAAQNRLLALNYCKNDNQQVFAAHKEWGNAFLNSLATKYTNYIVDLDSDKVLRIGYLSPDFFTHSISYFIEAILRNHDKNNFHVICYSNVVKEDLKTQQLKVFPSQWRNVYNKSTEEVASMIHKDKIDILIELTGHTAGNRLDVVAMKPAPIQITYLGYPNTTGLQSVDYRFVDEYTDPWNTSQQFTEELVRLPKCFLTYTYPQSAPAVASLPALTNKYITFGSFNNLAKISHNVIAVWSSIIRNTPNSRFVMKCKPFASAAVQQRILSQFASNGVDSSRIDLMPLMQRNYDHLKAYELVDIALDSWPYAGTTTTCESLYMGVPVITLKGDCHSHCIGVSLLTQVGLTQWIASNENDYVRIAVQNAKNFELLQNIRSTLRDTMTNSYLCRSGEFTATLEKILRDLWLRYVKNQIEDA